MSTIHTINPQPPEEQSQVFQPRLDAEVLPDVTIFRLQHTPIDVRLTPVPNNLMVQVVSLWLQQHPNEAVEIIRDIKQKIKNTNDLLHTIQSTKL